MGAESFGITDLDALEILDSRGNPTLRVSVELSTGQRASAGVPSGASTGSREAVELRDGDADRYGGKGVTRAVSNVNGELAELLRSRTWSALAEVDRAMNDADGTGNKARLGANAIIGVSMALARALAGTNELYTYLRLGGTSPRLPVPHFNVLNGGAHAPNSLDFQEFMIAPIGAPSLPEAVRAGATVYGRLRSLLQDRGFATGLGDEGGFAPDITRPEDVLALLVEAIEGAGYTAGRAGVAIALDPAASEFYDDGSYRVAGESLTSTEMIERYAQMVADFPVWSIEDGLAEGDWDGWVALTERLAGRAQIMGDDIFVTNPAIITEAIGRKLGSSALIKLNQIGSVSETLEAMRLCRDAGYTQMVSHRSGETEDSFIADLTVGTGCGQLKSGAPARGERVAKYNRLLQIAATTDLPYGLA
ncbi:phosphopyruvate hydratase [Georgenia muralis]|uniref:Enolase n=1 Tax=Georgenia muralis TaxID=154117 RepID=A0A3N4Z6S5_9MICO|nr:phosphopyruvate hydratase [Georgenia muralis]RPF28033.1 enolase [Georgenia muralis]